MTEERAAFIKIMPMSRADASEIAAWAYDEPYAVYSFDNTPETRAELMNGEYYAAHDENGLYGYYCYGASARIPAMEEDVYASAALDMGLGMKPKLCAKGAGFAFVMAGLQFAQASLKAQSVPFRLTVAAFNHRAIHLYEQVGFVFQRQVTHRASQKPFYVMVMHTP